MKTVSKAKEFLLSVSIKKRFIITTVGLILLLGIITSSIVYFTLTGLLSRELRRNGITITRHLAANSVDPILTQNIIQLQHLTDNIVEVEKNVLYAYITDSHGSVIVHTFERSFPENLKGINPADPGQPYSVKLLKAGEDYIQDISVPIFNGIGEVHLGLSESYIKEHVSNTIWILLIITLGIMGLGGIIAALIVAKALKPLDILSKGAEELGSGNLKHRINVSTKGEVGKFAETFNQMAENLINTHNELRESEGKLRAIFNNAMDGILLADIADKKFYTGNKILCKMLGYGLDEIMDLGIMDIHPEESLPHVIEQFEKQARGELSLAKNIPVKRKDGTVFYADINASTITMSGKDYMLGIFRDITERKNTERDLIQSHLELTTLYKVSSEISKTIEMDKLLEIILYTLTMLDVFDIKHRAGIFIIEDDRMKLVSQLGHTDEFLDLHGNMKIGDCLCGLVAKTGEAIISKNALKDSRHTFSYPDMEPHGNIIIPLKAREKVLGILYLYLPVDFSMDEHKLRMLFTIGNQIGIAMENARLFEETKKSSLHDPLTGLANRRFLEVVLQKNFAMAKRFNKPFSLIMADIDYFKDYNDKNGHIEGDKMLIRLADLLQKETRGSDLVVRYGGEEFLVLLSETDIKKACKVAEIKRKTVETETEITISLGVASYSHEMLGEDEIINKADAALYKAKQNGRNRVELCKQ